MEGHFKRGDILDLAVLHDVVVKSGAWYSYNGEKIGQGRENTKIYLSEHPELMTEIEALVRAKCGFGGDADGGETDNNQKYNDKNGNKNNDKTGDDK